VVKDKARAVAMAATALASVALAVILIAAIAVVADGLASMEVTTSLGSLSFPLLGSDASEFQSNRWFYGSRGQIQ
jgi:hypothetical protein